MGRKMIDIEAEESAWFAGPKAENGDWFGSILGRIVHDYYAWRRNYFPEDGLVIDSRARRASEPFRDEFEDRLHELLARLKGDIPFHSPRYAAHMVAEQTLPSIAGYFAAMLYNPNNVSREAAPVTVRLEHEACQMINQMVGYGPSTWGHLTGGGTVANIEALWVARTVSYLPQVVQEMRRSFGLEGQELATDPQESLVLFAQVFRDAEAQGHTFEDIVSRYLSADYCIVERGLHQVVSLDGRQPIVLVPETHHYCFEKALDVLGIGRKGLVSVKVDPSFRMDVSDLRSKLDDADKQACRVLAVVAVVGTTEEGAVDPVDEILDLRETRRASGNGSFWLHADGAYGGYLRTMTIPDRIGLGEPWSTVQINGNEVRLPLALPEKYACDALERLGEADSVTIDPHKLGYIPYPAGDVCFRTDLVKPLLRQEAPYLGERAGDPDAERSAEGIGLYILEGSKPGAAAAAVWLSHSLIKLDTSGHGQLVRQTVRNACELHSLLENWRNWEDTRVTAHTLTPPGSNIVCFAFRPTDPSATLADINAMNRYVCSQFMVEGDDGRRVYDQKFFVSHTTLWPTQYQSSTVGPFLARLGVSEEEYEKEGVFLLRSVLMNPWYGMAKRQGRQFLLEMVRELFSVAETALDPAEARTPRGFSEVTSGNFDAPRG